MLTQRLQQHGVITDLSQVSPDQVAAMAQRAEQAKQQAQYAVVYSRAVKSVLSSLVKATRSQADLYKAADEKLREVDKHKLSMLKSELGHDAHVAKMAAQGESERQVAMAKKASVVEVEQARLQGRLIALGIKHRQRLRAARGKRQGLLGGIFR